MKHLSDIYPQNTPTLSAHISETEQEGKPRILMFDQGLAFGKLVYRLVHR